MTEDTATRSRCGKRAGVVAATLAVACAVACGLSGAAGCRGAEQPAVTVEATIEIRVMRGPGGSTAPSPAVLAIAERALARAGARVAFIVDEHDPVAMTSYLGADDLDAVLADSGAGDGRPRVVFALLGPDAVHGRAWPPPGPPGPGVRAAYTSAFVFTAQIARDHDRYRKTFERAGITREDLIARTLVHEIGHLFGAEHTPADAAVDVMTPNSALGSPDSGGEADADSPDRGDADSPGARWRAATLGPDGRGPVFLHAAPLTGR